ncbi:MAG: hypothetical protein GX557_06355 [Chloroflexi bacterium]|nr:hypothetical protein [Chloroflexota bacterium]
MNPRERVKRALDRTGPDRLPVHYEGTPEITQALCDHVGVGDRAALIEVLGGDLRYVGPAYIGPERKTWPDGSREGMWRERYADIPYGNGLGTYPEAVFLPFAGIDDPDKLRDYPWPTADHYDYAGVEAACDRIANYAVCLGGAGVLDFMNGLARARGVEQVLLDVATEDPVWKLLMEKDFEFFYTWAERTLRAANGKIDLLHCGEDLGTQRGPIISMRAFESMFASFYRDLFELAHRYGARSIMHSCGSVRFFIPRLIELGLDVLDVVQVAAEGMDLAGLKRDFGADLSFCGTMCVQTILPYGTPADVERETRWRMELFADGGLILAPTHAIQIFTPLENVLTMYRTVGSLRPGL